MYWNVFYEIGIKFLEQLGQHASSEESPQETYDKRSAFRDGIMVMKHHGDGFILYEK